MTVHVCLCACVRAIGAYNSVTVTPLDEWESYSVLLVLPSLLFHSCPVFILPKVTDTGRITAKWTRKTAHLDTKLKRCTVLNLQDTL